MSTPSFLFRLPIRTKTKRKTDKRNKILSIVFIFHSSVVLLLRNCFVFRLFIEDVADGAKRIPGNENNEDCFACSRNPRIHSKSCWIRSKFRSVILIVRIVKFKLKKKSIEENCIQRFEKITKILKNYNFHIYK